MLRFKTKIDIWIKAYFVAVELYFGFLIVTFIVDELYTLLVIPVGIGILLVDILRRSQYDFKETHLLIRSGIFFMRIKYEEIESVKYKKGIMRNFALSSDQLIIKIKNKGNILGRTFVSPNNREDFIIELKKYCNFTESEV